MERLRQDVKIALIQSPAGVMNRHSLERGDGFAVDSSSSPPFDHRKQCGTQAHIGDAASLLRPVGEPKGLLKSLNLLPYLWWQRVKAAMLEQVGRLWF